MAFTDLPEYICPYGADTGAFQGKESWLYGPNGKRHYEKHCDEFRLPSGRYISCEEYLAIACLIKERPLEGTLHWVGADNRDYFWHPPTGILVVVAGVTPITMFRAQPMRVLRKLSHLVASNPEMLCYLWENNGTTTGTLQEYLNAYWQRIQQQHPGQPHWQDEVFDVMDIDDNDEEIFDLMDIEIEKLEDVMDVDQAPPVQPFAEMQAPLAYSPQQAQVLHILEDQAAMARHQAEVMYLILLQQQSQGAAVVAH